MTERALLIGCGDLGLRVAQRLLARNITVYTLRRSPPTEAGALHWLQGDISQPDGLPILPLGITRLIFLVAPDTRQESAYRSVFIDGVRHVRQALNTQSLQRVVFVSSSAVYGEHQGAWVNEATPPAPLSFNGQILLEAEALFAAYPGSVTCLRLAGLYGPGRLHLLARLRAGTAGAPVTPPHWANRIHIDDAAAAIAHLSLLPQVAPVYIGCDDTPLPLHTFYADLARQLHAPPPPIAPAPAHVGSKRLSNARLRASGLTLQWPDARQGYQALLNVR